PPLADLFVSLSSLCCLDDDPLQPVTQDATVSVGGTVTLTCRVAASDNSSLQWSNTAQQTLYFGEKRALRDNRIQLHRSTGTELSITIGNVQLSDEGEYTCSIFTMPVRTARATVTVLGVCMCCVCVCVCVCASVLSINILYYALTYSITDLLAVFVLGTVVEDCM
uniref:Cell adhesion molecule 3 n=1 Tax=Hucho hucho TaxID=62062 RepID=A0A4W5M5U8_9TELE